MSYCLIAVALILGISTGAWADDDAWKERLTEDLVAVEEGKFIYRDLAICKFKAPAGSGTSDSRKFQVRSYSEAPASGVISRDKFVSITTQTEMVMALVLANLGSGGNPLQALDALDCDRISEPIGTVELDIRILMTAEGMQTELTGPDGTMSRVTETWSDTFSK